MTLTAVKFQMNRHKAVRGGAHTRYLATTLPFVFRVAINRIIITSSYRFTLHRGSYMSSHFFNLLNGLGEKDKLRGVPSILSPFSQRV